MDLSSNFFSECSTVLHASWNSNRMGSYGFCVRRRNDIRGDKFLWESVNIKERGVWWKGLDGRL